MNSWKKIWENKALNFTSTQCDKKILLSELMKLDGFDSGFSNYSEESWGIMVDDLIQRLQLSNSGELLEVGCGAGALLYDLKNKVDLNVYGIDYSETLIKIAQSVLHEKESFIVSEAVLLPFHSSKFDYIISHGVFVYFQNYSYALNVLSEIFRCLKDGGKVCLMEINDSEKKSEYIEMRIKLCGSEDEYKKRYPPELDHQYFDKKRFEKDIIKIGFKNASFFEHAAKNYSGSKYRFNLYFEK